jgi:hypothetical protein
MYPRPRANEKETATAVAHVSEPTIKADDAIPVAAFRSALRADLRTSDEIARANGLTPQRHLLLLMSAEGERRLARVFKSHEAERQKLRAILTELERPAR